MEERLRQSWKKWFRRDNLIVLVLLGVLLFVIALPTKKAGEGAGKAEDNGIFAKTGGTGSTDAATPTVEADDYARRQEQRLAGILSSMEGVGKVEVMLTIAASEELVVEKDTEVSHSATDEKDSAGGSRTTEQTETARKSVCGTAGGGSAPYVIKTLSPRVEGVLVVAEGAGTGEVNRHITQIAQALFGVEAHRVKVVPMG